MASGSYKIILPWGPPWGVLPDGLNSDIPDIPDIPVIPEIPDRPDHPEFPDLPDFGRPGCPET